MTDTILLTGASGNLGRQITKGLAEAGYALRLTDIAHFPDSLPPGATFTQADLAEADTLKTLAEGCKTILHFGGASTEHPFNDVLGPNIAGLFHIYEAARAAKARVVFASSNHAIGFHPRSEKLDSDCALNPDGYYGLSKAYGELMGGMYFNKHGVENVNIRIGSCFPAPINARMLATYLSFGDLVRLLIRCIETPVTGSCVVWGASNNSRTFWGKDARATLGWVPQDTADTHEAELADKVSGDPVEEKYQGGGYTRIDYSRPE
jgi:uronate dehydrogenase